MNLSRKRKEMQQEKSKVKFIESVDLSMNLNIGKDVIVGAGSVVVKDIESRITVVGNPARSLITK